MRRPSPAPAPALEALRPYTVPAAGRRGLLRCDFNENLLGPSPRVLRAIRASGPDDLALYPDEGEARAAVARHFGLAGDLDLVLTAGADEAIRLVCEAYLRPRDRVVLVEPGYPLYRFYAERTGAAVRPVSPAADLACPSGALRRALGEGARLLILGDPHNPSGAPAPEGLVEDLARDNPGTVILVDEAYADFAGRTSLGRLDSFPNLIVARSFSKGHGLAGLRAGALAGRRETIRWPRRLRSPYAVNGLALLAVVAALEDPGHLARTVREVRAARAHLTRGLRGLGAEPFPSAANFVLARFGAAAPAIGRALRERGILVRDRGGEHPLLAGTLRIGVGTRRQATAVLEAIAAIRRPPAVVRRRPAPVRRPPAAGEAP